MRQGLGGEGPNHREHQGGVDRTAGKSDASGLTGTLSAVGVIDERGAADVDALVLGRGCGLGDGVGKPRQVSVEKFGQ